MSLPQCDMIKSEKVYAMWRRGLDFVHLVIELTIVLLALLMFLPHKDELLVEFLICKWFWIRAFAK